MAVQARMLRISYNFNQSMLNQLRKLGRDFLNSYFRQIQLGPESSYAKEYRVWQTIVRDLPDDLDPHIVKGLQEHAGRDQRRYFFDYRKRATIDPLGGCLLNSNQVIVDSIPYGLDFGVTSPSFFSYRFRKKRVIHVNEAVSIRYGWNNYWHFLNDVLGQMCMLDDFGIPFETPIVVPNEARSIRFVQEAFQRSAWLRNRRWIFQTSDVWVVADRWYFCRTQPPEIEYLLRSLHHLGATNPSSGDQRMVYVSRRTAHDRRLQNETEIEEIARMAGLDVLEPRSLQLAEQMSVFANAVLVVGPHGSGLTNLLFRRSHPMVLFELFPSDCIRPHYFWLSQQFGHGYSAMMGSQLLNNEYWLNPTLFKSHLDQIISTLAKRTQHLES